MADILEHTPTSSFTPRTYKCLYNLPTLFDHIQQIALNRHKILIMANRPIPSIFQRLQHKFNHNLHIGLQHLHSGIHTVDLSDDRVDYPHEDEIELVGGGLLES